MDGPMSVRAADGGRRVGRGDIVSLLAAAPVEPMRVGAIITLVTAILAVQSVEAELLPYRPEAPEAPASDPVLVRVGDGAVRLSDLRAQAGAAASTVSPDVLVREGYLDDAAQQLALAQAAEDEGLADALEVRAALALARRRVLSEAYLDLAVSRAVTDEAVRAAYDAEVRAARAHDRVALRHVLVATEERASELARRAERGERFARLAARSSQDQATKDRGGSFGMIHPDALPEGLREVAATAPLGAVLGPLRTEDGWHVVRVDARRKLAVPSLARREPVIREALRARAMRAAAARAATSMRIERAPPAAALIAPRPASPDALSGAAPPASPSVSPQPGGGASAQGLP